MKQSEGNHSATKASPPQWTRTLRELSQVLEISKWSLSKWVASGELIKKSHGYNIEEARRILERRASRMQGGDRTGMDASSHRDRYHKARAEKLELDVQARRGELVSQSEVKLAWSQKVEEVRQAFINMGSDLAPRLVGKKERDIKMILDKHIFDATNKLADAEYCATKGEHAKG